MGPPQMRPGQLYEPLDIVVADAFAAAAQAAGIATALAVAVTTERYLVLADLGAGAAAAAVQLDVQASSVLSQLRLSTANSDFARLLLAALHSRLPPVGVTGAIVVPSRLADRVREARDLELRPEDLRQSLAWELASVRAGRTMTEWALAECLGADCYSLAAARQPVAAASAAR